MMRASIGAEGRRLRCEDVGRLKHLLLGSVAENIIRHAPCPVFVVRADVD